jgi:hypothetical protein
MHFPILISGLLYAFAIIIRSFVAIAPLCNDIIAIARGGLLNISKLLSILTSIVKGI